MTTLVAGDPGVAELRAALWSAGYTTAGLSELLGFSGHTFSVPPGQVSVIDRQLPRGEPLPTLVRLFLLALPVPVEEAAAALGTLSPERCAGLGVATVADGHIESTIRLLPSRDLVVVCDKRHEFSPDLDAEHVMSITPSTNLLADLTIRRPVGDVLDLCCGGGVQALLAARHARRVVATDLNPRAIGFAEFSAVLNGLANVELRQGDLFDPVAGELFDLIVANPPFIISPDSSYAFRDSPLEGDEISRVTVRGAAEHLREGGLAFVLVGWGHRDDEPWSKPLRSWVEGIGCDAWVLRQTSTDPVDYAVGFNRPLAPVDPKRYEEAIDRWVEYDARLGYESIGYGAMILRRRAGENWLRADDLHQPHEGPAGAHVEQLIASQDLLASLDGPEAMLDLVLRTNEHHRLEQVLRKHEDGYAVEQARVVLEEGLGFLAMVDVNAAQILVTLDGKRTLRSVLDEARSNVHPNMPEAEFYVAALPVARRMIELGFVLPVG